MKHLSTGIAFLSIFGMVDNLKSTSDLIDNDGLSPTLARPTFATDAQIELPVGVLQEWLKSYLKKPAMITHSIEGEVFHIMIKGFEKKHEVDVFLNKSSTDMALFTPFKGRTTSPVGSWFYHEYWELWFYVSRHQIIESNFS